MMNNPHFQVKAEFTNLFDCNHNTVFATKSIQTALGIKADGKWGNGTTKAVNDFRRSQGYKIDVGQLGSEAFKVLLTRLS